MLFNITCDTRFDMVIVIIIMKLPMLLLIMRLMSMNVMADDDGAVYI